MSQTIKTSEPPGSNADALDGAGLGRVSPLGSHTAHGAFWTILFSMLNKVVAFGSQIALAWFLLPADFGLVGMAFSVTSMAALISGMNLKAVLVQRQDRFEQDVGQVFWLSLVMGLTGTVLLAVAAPVAGIIFKDHRVAPLILVVAIAGLPGSALAIYAAALSRDLRFRTVAIIQFGSGMIINLGAVLLAALHFGPYSLVIPSAFSSFYALVAHRVAVGRIPIPRPKPSEWLVLSDPFRIADVEQFFDGGAGLWGEFCHWVDAQFHSDGLLLLGLFAGFAGGVPAGCQFERCFISDADKVKLGTSQAIRGFSQGLRGFVGGHGAGMCLADSAGRTGHPAGFSRTLAASGGCGAGLEFRVDDAGYLDSGHFFAHGARPVCSVMLDYRHLRAFDNYGNHSGRHVGGTKSRGLCRGDCQSDFKSHCRLVRTQIVGLWMAQGRRAYWHASGNRSASSCLGLLFESLACSVWCPAPNSHSRILLPAFVCGRYLAVGA